MSIHGRTVQSLYQIKIENGEKNCNFIALLYSGALKRTLILASGRTVNKQCLIPNLLFIQVPGCRLLETSEVVLGSFAVINSAQLEERISSHHV